MKIFTGTVTSTKMQKTATVSVDRVITHPIYNKRVKRNKKYQVHNELDAQTGQKVKFVASMPFSKTKKWKIIEIVNSAKDKKQSTKDKK